MKPKPILNRECLKKFRLGNPIRQQFGDEYFVCMWHGHSENHSSKYFVRESRWAEARIADDPPLTFIAPVRQLCKNSPLNMLLLCVFKKIWGIIFYGVRHASKKRSLVIEKCGLFSYIKTYADSFVSVCIVRPHQAVFIGFRQTKDADPAH